MDTPLPTPRQPTFQFELTDAAAQHNLEVLRQHQFDLHACLAHEKGTPLQAGSEFRPTPLLSPLLCSHPLWPKVTFYLIHGVDFAMEEITEDDRQQHNAALSARGNHKNAVNHPAFMRPIFESEVTKGWLLALPEDSYKLIPHALLGPIGLAFQGSIDETGKEIEKERPTHDLSFNPVPELITSLNARVLKETLTPCKYGLALLRFIHYIVWLRLKEPTMPIFLTKSDWKAAYRRFHNHPYIATRCMLKWEDHEFLALRMTFGGSPFPNIWSDLAETACDLANDLARSGRNATKFQTPALDRLPSVPQASERSVPFAAARPMAIPDFPDTLPRSDNFIDDAFCAFLLNHWGLGRALLPYVIELIGRPRADDEPLPRDACLSLTKFLAEATPEEKKIILGWLLNTRALTIALPLNKVEGWTEQICGLLRNPTATAKDLQKLVGRLNHVGHVVPASRHFLGNLRAAESTAARRPSKRYTLRGSTLADLHLWKEILKYAGAGISLNLLTTRCPNRWWRSDACEHGIGGYNVLTGRAWRWTIPPKLRFRASINCLEFIGGYVNLHLAVLEGDLQPEDVILLETDSTSAEGWMHKTNVADEADNPEDRPLLLHVARTVARLTMQSKTALAPAYLRGTINDCSDCLSRDDHLSDEELTTLLFNHVPEQLTMDFHISPLPPTIVSQLYSWLQRGTPTKESHYRPTRSGHSTGTCGCDSLCTSNSTTTPSSITLTHGLVLELAQPLQERIGQVSSKLKERTRTISRLPEGQSTPHWETWQRPLGLTTVPIPLSTPTANGTSFYSNRSKRTSDGTPKRSSRKRSQPGSSDTSSPMPSAKRNDTSPT
jgi:hypothetical protein